MTFYQSIANHYEHIFPLNKAQLDFVKSSFDSPVNLSLLDIGCGTGSLSLELAGLFSKVTAIDLDVAMLKKAIEKNDKGINFQKLNMLDIKKEYGQNAFDAVVCFGNTLVHLDGAEEVLNFFKQARIILKKNGKLLFQIINYDRIIDRRINSLPTIENDLVKFVRNYDYTKKQDRVNFETILTIKSSGQVIKNTIPLYPLRKIEINQLLNQSGFNALQFYGNFKKDSYAFDSIPLIVEAG